MTVQRDRLADDGVTRLLDLESTSKIRILDAPIQAPGVCGLCGASSGDENRKYIDIGIWIEYYGQFYFCTFCFTEFTNRLGGHTSEQALALENELDSARQRILEFETKDAALNGAINTLRDTGLFSGTDLTVVRRRVVSEQSEESESIIQDTVRPESKTIGFDHDSEQSDSKQGSNDLSATSSDELDLSKLL